MPTFNFSRQWKQTQLSKSGYFISDELNDKNENEGVSIDDTQVNVEFKYKNLTDKTISLHVDYSEVNWALCREPFFASNLYAGSHAQPVRGDRLNLFCCGARFAFVSL
jgi:hypothetical protein